MTFFSRQAQSQTISPVTKRTAFLFALAGLINLVVMTGSHAVSIGGCDNYVPLNGDVVVCAPTVTPIAGQGVIAPDSNTTNNNISVTIQAGTFLDINGSTIGLGSSSTVVNDGRLNTQSFFNGYGISAGVNGRSQLGGNSMTNNGDITTAGSNAHGIIISAAAITNGANNTIINTGLIQTAGTGDGIRLFTTARGVTNQISNSGSIVTAAAVAGIRLRSTESTDTISNTGTITMSGVDGVGILVLNTLNRPTVSNSGTITTTGAAGYAIYGDGAMALINSGTLTSDVYAIYFEDGTRSSGSNSVTLNAGSNITGGLKFNASKTSETLVFDGLVDSNFNNMLVNVNNISAIQSASVTMNAASYSFGASQINVDLTSQLTISAPIGDAAIATSITKSGAGILTLSGQSTYTGATSINAGILQANVANALPTSTAVTINAGTLALNNVNQTIGSLAGAGSVTLGSGTLTVNSAANSDFAGDISGTGNLIKDGVGTLALSGQSTYTGATSINAGILQANVANALPTSTAVTINAGTLALNNVNQTIGSLAGAGAVTLGTGTLTMGGNGSNTSYSGIISGTGGLTKDGAGTFTLLGNSTYSGSTVVDAGTLKLGVANAVMQTALTVNTGGTFDLNNFNQTLTGLAGAGSVTLGSGTLTVNSAASVGFGGDISGTGGLTKDGAGTLALSGQSTYTGATTINAGILQANVANALPTSTAVTINAGTLALNNVSQTIGSLAGAGAVTLGTGTLTMGGNGSNTSYSGIISGTGGLDKLGSGTLALSAANTYSGGTLLSQGVLVLANDNALGTGSLETAQDTTLRAGKANLTLANSVVVQGDTTIDTAGELVLLTGAVSGTGKLIKVGAGTLELAGVNSYSGGTQIEQGALALDVNGAASTGEVVMAAGTTIQADATLALDNLIKLRGEVEVNTQSFDVTFNNAVTNNSVGVLVKTGSGMLTLNGVNTYTGGTTLVEGTLSLYGRLASGVQIGSGTLLAGTGTINGDVVNRGIIQPRLNGSRSTLTIVGNYSGDNGTFASSLEGTAPNAIVADQLAIVGAGSMASGSTTIAISDPSGVLGQPTTGDGILLVGFSDGATGTETAFRSDRIAAGAYEYQLVRGGESSAQDWYLRADNNTPAPPMPVTPQTAQREEVALYPILPSLARQYLMSITGTLDERRGAPDSLPKERVAWARVIAQNNETSPPNANDGPGLKANDWGLQIGADLVRADLDAGHWRMGPVLTIGRSTGQAYNNSGSFNTGSVSLNGYSLGLNATLAMDNGAYFDVLVQGTRLTGVSANSPLGTSIHTTGWGLSGSVEGGWRLGMSDTVSLTPQAQLYGVHTQLVDSSDLYSRIEMPNDSMLVGRVGLKISYESKPMQGPKTQLWGRVSALSTLSGRDASTSFLNVAGTNPTVFQSQAPATWMSLDAGVTVNAAPNTQINIGLGYQTSFNGQFTAVSGQINVRIGF